MDIKSIITNKGNQKELSDEEIKFFINKYNKGEVTEAQAGALMSYIYKSGTTIDEIVSLSVAMANTGKIIDLEEMGKLAIDKHSTGGVGDKVTLILMPVIAALEIPFAKISSRGMGITAGTIDKLETIPGFMTDVSIGMFKKNIKDVGIGILNQSQNLNPVENKMYKLRNEIACTDCVPLIAASLMSIKISTGSQNIVFEITYGSGTYIKNKEQAKMLAKILKTMGKKLNKRVMCVITNMDEPLGYAIGHNLEMIEAIQALKGKLPFDLGEVVVAIGSVILELMTGNKNSKANEEKIKEVISSGKAYEKFMEMISAGDGDISYIENIDKFEKSEFILPVYATNSGYIEKVDADIVASIVSYLGAGRIKNDEEFDRTAGIVLNKKIGDEVSAGEIIAYIHTNDESKVIGATKNLEEAFKISSKKAVPRSRIMGII